MSLRRLLIGGGILLALVVVIVVAVLVGIYIGRGTQDVAQKGSDSEQTSQPVAQTTQAAANNEQTKAARSKTIPSAGVVVGLGETATFSDRTVTVNDLQSGFAFPYNIPRPQSGNEFVLVNITIENTSTQPIQVNPLNFQSEDPNGVRLNAQATNNQPDPITVSSIAPNGKLTGNLVVEAPQGASDIKLVYRPLG